MRKIYFKFNNGFLVPMFAVVIILLSVILLLLNDNGEYNTAVAVMVLALNILALYRARKNMLFAFIVLVITYYNYSICAANYLWLIKTTMFTGYAETAIGSYGLRVLLVFSIVFYGVVSSVAKKLPEQTQVINVITENPENLIIVIFLSVALVLIWVYGFGRPTTVGQRGSPSTYFEYSLILIILAYYYSGQNILWKIIISIIGIAYVGLNLLYGGRATGIQVLICMLFCTIVDRIPKKWILVGGFMLFLLMSLVGTFRTATELSSDSLNYIWSKLKVSKFSNDTAYSSYFTSMTILDFSEKCSWGDRLYYFWRWLLSIPLGGRVTDSNLPVVTRRFYTHYFGGVFPYYFQFFLGYAGVLLVSLYLHWLFSKIFCYKGSRKGLWRCIGVYVAATSFRWYVYSPSQVTRGVLLLSIVYGALYLLNKMLATMSSRSY